MDIENPNQINKIIEGIARKVISDATEEILSDFKREYVEKHAYVVGSPKVYPRGFEFRDAWIWDEIKRNADTLTTMMFNDWSGMQTPSPRGKSPFIHTTFTSSGTRWADDSRKYLAEALDKMNPSIWLTGNRTGGYWDKFKSGYVNSGKMKRVIDKHARKHGLETTAG